MKPTGTFIQLKVKEVAQQTASGIYTSTASTKTIIEEYAEVSAVGPDVKKIKKGDTVYFKEYDIYAIDIGSFAAPEYLYFLKEESVIAVEK